jgi:NifU-like protein involved in Fe-S cluster formation
MAALRSVRGYHQNIIDHYEAPRNVGSMDKNDPNVGTGLVGAPACGDVMKLQLRVGPDGKVEEAVFKVRSAAELHACQIRPSGSPLRPKYL